MNIRNLTPHILTIQDTNDRIMTLNPSGLCPRRETITRTTTPINIQNADGSSTTIGVNIEALGPVVGLPDQVEGVVLVVSRLVAQDVPHRSDVFAPGDLVRDEHGRPVSARGLVRVVPASWILNPRAGMATDEHD